MVFRIHVCVKRVAIPQAPLHVQPNTLFRMGFFYRKSIKVGPFRINASHRGIGVSTGVPGLRVGVNNRGKRYTQVSLPGTGVGYRSTGKGCLLLLVGFPAGMAALWLTSRLL